MITSLAALLESGAQRWWDWMLPMAVQIALLVLALATLSWLLRRASARLRYALWLLVPIRLVLPPGLAFVTGWSWWLLPPAPAPEVVVDAPRVVVTAQQAPLPEALAHSARVPVSPPAVPAAKSDKSIALPPAATAAAVTPRTGSLSWRGWLFVGWLALVAAALARLAWGASYASSLVRTATPVADREVLSLAAQLAQKTSIRRPVSVRVSRSAQVPMVIGEFRPTIILPESIHGRLTRSELGALLMHELQHVSRHDPLVNLLQTLLGAVYFYHPLVWLANARLTRLREEACDEATIAALDGRRQDYGSGIVKMAELVSGRRPQLALGVVESGSQVKRRLLRILDPRLPFGGRLSWSALALLLVAAAILLPSAARPAPRPVDNAEARQEEDAAAATDNSGPANPPAPDRVQVRGRVLNLDGQPLPGADVFFSYAGKESHPPIRATTDARGDFELVFRKSELDKSYRADPWTSARVIALADGYGAEWTEAADATRLGEVVLKLAPDVTLRGRILDLEGRPIPEVQLRVRSIRETADQNLDQYIAAVAAGQHHGIRFAKYWWEAFPGRPETMRTDADGGFELSGVGPERVVELYLEHPAIHNYWITAITRQVENVSPPRESPNLADRHPVYGATFDHLAPPGRTIEGTVRDRTTNQPIAGVTVRGGLTAGGVSTDDQGRYRLTGCLKQEQYHLEALATQLPYFVARVEIADTPGLDPIRQDIELVQGIQLRGRVTDETTGEPVQGGVFYSPLSSNEHIGQLGERINNPCSTAPIQPDGSYRLTVLPGPGVIGVRAHGYYEDYMPALITRQQLEERFPAIRTSGRSEDFLTVAVGPNTMSLWSQTNYNALVLVEPDEDMHVSHHDFVLEPGLRLSGQVTDPDGDTLTGATVIGLTSHTFHLEQLEADSFLVRAINPGRGRHLLFYHAERDLGLALDIKGTETEPLVVRLQPCGSVSGRLVDSDGQPLGDVTVQCSREGTSGPGGNPWSKTDPQGRFRVRGLVPAQRYTVRVAHSDFYALADELVVGAGEAKDLGTVRERGPGR